MKRLYMMDSCYYEHAVFSSHVVLNSDSTMDQSWCVGCVVCLCSIALGHNLSSRVFIPLSRSLLPGTESVIKPKSCASY